MEKSRTFGGRIEFFWGLLGLFLLFCCTKAEDGVIKQVPDPTGNVNLSPFQQWRSAYECMQNTSNSCPEKYKLTEAGWVNVTLIDTTEYCKPGGCAQHTMAVLTCIDLVKRDYKFGSKATVQELNNTIIRGCSSGFNGTNLIASDARKMYGSKTIIPLVSALAVLFLIGLINM